MARDNDPWKRMREREEEAEAERLQNSGDTSGMRPQSGSTDQLLELMKRAEPLIEQLNNLYNMHFTGVEKRAPIERRQHLDQLMATLTLMGKPTAALQFRFGALNNQYVTYRDRWDRTLKDLEEGKRKR